ncbi:MAG: hypothetical protein EBZ77_10830, partial [Chitinophagia bacterium]|nr:hypothetical protein [Chitinophagia bacterium]
MWKFFTTEMRYWLKAPMTWIFFGINLLLVMGAVSSDNVSIGGGVGSVHKNAPHVIQMYYGVFSVFFGLLMTTAFMNASANRDFQYNMYQLVFASPIKKAHYFFGKFFGAYVAAIIPMLGVTFGALIGPLMPWAQASRFGAASLDGDIWGILSFVLPNVFITGVLLFSLALIFRNNIISFVGAIAMLVLWGISGGLIRDIQNEWLGSLL